MPNQVIRLTKDPPMCSPKIEAKAVCDICGRRLLESQLAVSKVNGETICLRCQDEEV